MRTMILSWQSVIRVFLLKLLKAEIMTSWQPKKRFSSILLIRSSYVLHTISIRSAYDLHTINLFCGLVSSWHDS